MAASPASALAEPAARSATAELETASPDVEVRVGIHDATRLEWSVSLPLPERDEVHYVIDVELDIPSNAFARHAPWDQLQSFTRLDGPAETIRVPDVVTIDSLRRGAVALANRLARASDGFARHCRFAISLSGAEPIEELEATLSIWVDAALAMVVDARKKLTIPAAGEAQELVRERTLVDEYASVRLLELLAGIVRALETLLESDSPRLEAFPAVVSAVGTKVADALGQELSYRASKGYVNADPMSLATLEQYLDRASQLKKHFQEVLFLEAEIYQVADRIHHWVAAFVAVVASTWAFAWQIALVNHRPTTESQVGSGIVMVAVFAGLVYAVKDRIKEFGRAWIAGNVHRFYAQRVARYRAPARRLPKRDVIVSARESFDQVTSRRPDPLNPESGASLVGTLLRYMHKGTVSPQPGLGASGVRRIKHVFRYDFSPLFARLDDAVKQVPVLDRAPRRVRFIDAPRCYKLPVTVRVQCGDVVSTEQVTLVLHKRGLDRLERVYGHAPPGQVDHKETGIEPDH
ncbi:hypothetical protein LZC95_11370 [Pendulispora brunnea]|uniref:Uncharacterized protein n=1 Tax=Pendulispora brunnea TaxID=2905690 RepID=A0ABZ2KJC7_9BACT